MMEVGGAGSAAVGQPSQHHPAGGGLPPATTASRWRFTERDATQAQVAASNCHGNRDSFSLSVSTTL